MGALENYNVVSDIKACLLEDILTDDKAVRLIKHQKNVTLPGLDLRYTQVFPWRKMLGTQEEARTLVTCEVDIPDVVTSATRIYRLKIFVIVPENQMRLDDKAGEMLGIEDRGSKLDVLCDRIDYLINGSKRYTYGELLFRGMGEINVPEKFNGKQLIYEIRGWNRAGERLG